MMYAARDRQIKSLLIFVSILWHCLILYVFFVITRKPSDEPLRITIHPKTVEFLLSRPQAAAVQPQAVQPATLLQSQPVPQALPQIAQTVVQQAPIVVPVVKPPALPEEEDQDRYKLKNPVSGGTLSAGSLVAGQPGPQVEDKGSEEEQEVVEQEKGMPENQALVDQRHDNAEQGQENVREVDSTQDVSVVTTSDVSDESKESAALQDGGSQAVVQQGVHQETMLEKLESYGGTFLGGKPHKEVKSQQSQAQANHNASGRSVTAQPSCVAKAQTMVPRQTAVKGLTLADITRGFVRNVKHEQAATSRYTYQGASRGQGVYAPPTSGVAMAEQMYASKIYSLLEQSAMAYSRKIYARQELDMETMLEVTIDKTGRILDVALNPCLAEKDMELALNTIVKSVGLFPPIPKQFKKQKIIVTIPLHIRSQQGFASYRLLYGMRTL